MSFLLESLSLLQCTGQIALWDWKKGCLAEEAAACESLGSEGGLHEKEKRG